MRAVDVLLAAPMAGLVALEAIGRGLIVPRKRGGRRAIVLDTAYSLETVRARSLGRAITCRDLGGFFDHVYTVHPLVGSSAEDAAHAVGPVEMTDFAPRHTVIQARVGRLRALRAFPTLNFVLAQGSLLRSLLRLRRQGIGVVRAGDPYYQGLLGLFVARAARAPLAVRVASNFDEVYAATGRAAYPRLFGSRAVEKRIERFVLRRADLVAGANENNREYAIASGAIRERTTVFRYGNIVHPAHFAPPHARSGVEKIREELALPDKKIVAYVGRLEAPKRAGDLVEALAEARARVPEVAFVLVGDGSLRPAMERRARELGVEDSLRFMGQRDQEWIAALMPSVCALVSPHMGRALVETALGGAPIAAYDIDWQREVVLPGQTGELVPVGDARALGRAVATLLMDEVRRARMGAAARELMLDLMDPERLDQREREAYARVMTS